MKIHIADRDKIHKETLDFYTSFSELSDLGSADVIISTDFAPIKTDKKVIVATNTTGLDHIDAPNAEIISLRGMDLSDFTAVPELCIGMAIYLTRILKREEIKKKTLGLIGYGRIAKRLEKYANDLGMVVRFTNDIGSPSKNVPLNILLNTSDIVSLHITADEKNRNFISLEKFKMMKDGAIFLNSARPWLVDESALKWALDNKLAGAWLDFDMPFTHPKLITTPHLGGSTKESTQKSEMVIARKIKELCKKK